jgi:hypothetical protein
MSEGLKTQDLSALDPTKLTALTPEVVGFSIIVDSLTCSIAIHVKRNIFTNHAKILMLL